MKSFNSLKKFGLALVAMTLMLTAANAQARYKHVPRVKIDKTPAVATVQEQKATNTTTTQIMNVSETNVATNEAITPAIENNSTVASSTEEVVIADFKTKTVVQHNKIVKNNKKADQNVFTNKVKNNSKLMDVKDVKKTNLERWLLIFIILMAVGIVFLILAFVFLFALYSLALYYVFLIIAVLCLIAAGVILPLGLAGVI
jgi:hypothetical protein